MNGHSGIAATSIVDDVVARHPGAFSVLNAFGVDTCCGGAASLAEAAAHAHVDVLTLVRALQGASLDDGGPS